MKCQICNGLITSTLDCSCNEFVQHGTKMPLEQNSRVYDRNIRLNSPEKELLNQIVQTLTRLEQKIDALEKK